MSYQNPFVTVPVSPTKSVIIERSRAAADIVLSADAREEFMNLFLAEDSSSPADASRGSLAELLPFEGGRQGLQDYF
ncbi:MAG: hypothetical protein R2864_01525 [Syntrophotaleaceae bacterium]